MQLTVEKNRILSCFILNNTNHYCVKNRKGLLNSTTYCLFSKWYFKER